VHMQNEGVLRIASPMFEQQNLQPRLGLRWTCVVVRRGRCGIPGCTICGPLWPHRHPDHPGRRCLVAVWCVWVAPRTVVACRMRSLTHTPPRAPLLLRNCTLACALGRHVLCYVAGTFIACGSVALESPVVCVGRLGGWAGIVVSGARDFNVFIWHLDSAKFNVSTSSREVSDIPTIAPITVRQLEASRSCCACDKSQ
jgi:hypothetical protein